MSMNIDPLIKVLEFQWFGIVPVTFAFTIISLGGIYLAFTIGSSNRKVWRGKSSKKSSEAIIKRFKKMHDLGIISPGQFESIKKDYSKK
jgi:hypothetical protein